MSDHRIILYADKEVINNLQEHSGHHFEGIADTTGVCFFDLICDCGQLVIPIYEKKGLPVTDTPPRPDMEALAIFDIGVVEYIENLKQQLEDERVASEWWKNKCAEWQKAVEESHP